MIPLDVRKHLKETPLEHSWRRDKHPVRRVDHLQIIVSVEFPYLGEENLIRVDDPRDLFLEGADDHGVGHDESEGMMELHLLVDSFEIFIFEEDASSRVMALEGADIEDVVVKNDKSLLIGLRVVGDLLHVFEFDVEF